MTRRSLSLIIAAIATVCSVIMFSVENLPTILGLMVLAGSVFGMLAAYIIGGGLLSAFKWSWNIAKVAWFLVPVFPVDLVIGFLGLFAAIGVFLFLPIFAVFFGGRKEAVRA